MLVSHHARPVSSAVTIYEFALLPGPPMGQFYVGFHREGEPADQRQIVGKWGSSVADDPLGYRRPG